MPIDPLHTHPLLILPKLLEVSHVAHRLSVSHRLVWKLIREGKLKALRIESRWRIDPRDLEAYIEAKRKERDAALLHVVPSQPKGATG